MTPELSEFSYGFALTHELVGRRGPLRAAPIFPSLIEEGRAGGGYDVRLDQPGVPLFIQFKRAECMVRGTAWEYRDGHVPQLPFYRLRITERKRSAQHELLLDLDDGTNEVFYAAPRFHTLREMNQAWADGTVEARSFFIRPRDIGRLDDHSHHVAFTDHVHFVCSEPRPVEAIVGRDLDNVILKRLKDDRRKLSDGPLSETLQNVREAIRRRSSSPLGSIEIMTVATAPTLGREAGSPPVFERALPLPRLNPAPDPLPPPRDPRTLEEGQLRDLSDLALQHFGTQLFIAQEG